jgi:hypothetical protein
VRRFTEPCANYGLAEFAPIAPVNGPIAAGPQLPDPVTYERYCKRACLVPNVERDAAVCQSGELLSNQRQETSAGERPTRANVSGDICVKAFEHASAL